jgi:hypothetical protein
MSPTIRPVPAIDPSPRFFLGLAEGCTTSATGSPNLVTRDRLTRAADALEESKAVRFELGNGDLLHTRNSFFVVYTMLQVSFRG